MGAGLIGEPQGMDLAGDEVDAGQQADVSRLCQIHLHVKIATSTAT
jgi:hypothetical protein